jgi:hypothetical protein
MRDIELSVIDIRTLCNFNVFEVFTIPSGSSTRLYLLYNTSPSRQMALARPGVTVHLTVAL